MLKECLIVLSETKLDIGEDRKKAIGNIINYYENDQLYYIMQSPQGMIVEDISIHYYPNVGFRCNNTDMGMIGRNPICNILQRMLNEQYNLIFE